MAQNQEQIEAKLAAYIDGELDEAGCAEIRKHLAGNPQHRKLVEDLIQTRDLVRGLPRQSAPSEISEAIQSQLERSVLLGGGSDYAAESTLRISRWPHPWAIAAILLLTAGLGVLVYKVLPSNKPPAEFAIATRETGPVPATLATADQPSRSVNEDALVRSIPEAADKSPGVLPAMAPAPSRDFSEVTAGPGGVPTPPSTQGLPGAPNFNNGALADAFRGASNSNGAVNSPLLNAITKADARMDQLATRGANEGQSAQTQGQPPINSPRSLYLIVSTSDPEAAKGQLRTYLASNQISYEPPLSEPPELKTDETVAQANRLRQEEARLNVTPPPADLSKAIADSPATVPTIALGPAGPATQPLASAAPAPARRLTRTVDYLVAAEALAVEAAGGEGGEALHLAVRAAAADLAAEVDLQEPSAVVPVVEDAAEVAEEAQRRNLRRLSRI